MCETLNLFGISFQIVQHLTTLPISESTKAPFAFLLLLFLSLFWFKSKQSHLIMYRGRDCKVFIEPMWK